MRLPIALVLIIGVVPPNSCLAEKAWIDLDSVGLEEVATSDRRWTGIAVSKEGRIFVNYPLWSASQSFAVGELQVDGSVVPYPDQTLNSWKSDERPNEKFVCVQAMYVDRDDRLWILDPANPRMEGVVQGGPKLFVFDLSRNVPQRIYRFDSEITPGDSYLNDVRIDSDAWVAYITDSGNGALIVLDLDTGQARRLLDEHPSTHAESIRLVVGGRPLALNVHADGIALSGDGHWLYYQALTGRTLYRVPTAALRNVELDDEGLAEHVETVAESGASDGLIFGPDGCVYTSAIEHDALRRVHPNGTVEVVIQDERISWPDSFALRHDGQLYFTTARIHELDLPTGPFAIYRLTTE